MVRNLVFQNTHLTLEQVTGDAEGTGRSWWQRTRCWRDAYTCADTGDAGETDSQR